MPYRRFLYSSFMNNLMRLILVLVMACCTFAMLFSLVRTGFSGGTLILLAGWLIIGIPIFTGGIHSRPEIRMSDNYFSIYYLFSRLQIPWDEVVGSATGESALLGRFCLVYFKKLPYFVRVNQFNPATIESEATWPFIVVYDSITDYEDLVAIIKAKTADPTARLYL
jgi:hypothetical protein